ncbi:hypothetical protein ACSBR2_029987 [Camellia fascicularis]
MMHVAADPSGIERNEVSQVLHDAAAADIDFDCGDRLQKKRVMTRLNTITRIAYKGDETIMAWELMNEPRCQSDYSGRTINGWVEEMAACVKSIDNQHLLEIGMEGFYGDSMPERKQVNPGYQVGTDFISSNLIKDTDFTTIHAYPDIWLSGQNENSQMPFMQKWVENHWADWGKIRSSRCPVSRFKRGDYNLGTCPDLPRQAPLKLGLAQRESIEPTPSAD